MTPGQVNFTIYRGTTFTDTFILRDENGVAIDLSGKKTRMQARTEVSDSDPLLTWTSEDGDMVITALSGTVAFAVSASETAALGNALYEYETLYYDLELYDDSVSPETVERVIQGVLILVPEVTRA